MKKRFVPFLSLIICMVMLLVGNLYTTKHAFQDITSVVLQQRTHYKLVAMERMGDYYFAQKNFTEKGFAEFLNQTRVSDNDIHGLAKFDTLAGFPLVAVYGPTSALKYEPGNALASITSLDKDSEAGWIEHLHRYENASDKTPTVVKNYNGDEYLLVWVVIPSPTPSAARYVYYTLTPLDDLLDSANKMKHNYMWLFVFGTVLSTAMLILIPRTVKEMVAR